MKDKKKNSKYSIIGKAALLVVLCVIGMVAVKMLLSDKKEAKEEAKEEQSDSLAKITEEVKVDVSKEEVKEDKKKNDRTEMFKLLEDMNVGWNLGNSLDAHSCADPAYSEESWGNIKTTKEMIDTVCEKGFNTIRIPITWYEHLGPAPEYLIDETFLNRVEEVINYALDNNAYVIINTHHEPSWLKPQKDGLEAVNEQLMAIWTQVATRFKDYDQRLIFEGLNEPRIKGSPEEWTGGTKEEREAVNVLNQGFVTAVRATGGNNLTRCLILATHGNAVNYNTLAELTIPEDNNIMVAVHLYTPYVFTYLAPDGNIETWDGSKKTDIINVMQLLDKSLIQKDVPVIITEFGCVNKSNLKDRLSWLSDYMGTAKKYGIKCIWWDNGNFKDPGETFSIFDRRNNTWFVPEIAEELIKLAE